MKNSLKIFTILIGVSLLSFTWISNGYKIGDKTSDFSLKNIDGKQVSLKDYPKAKGFIIVFTCNHCPFAKAYEQRIIDLDHKYASQGYPVIAINPNDSLVSQDDSYSNMVKRANEKKYSFPYLLDETQEVTQKFGALKTPHVFLLNKVNTDLVVAYIGSIDDNSEDIKSVKKKYLETAISEIQKGKKVSVAETKAIGCGIKWK